MAASKLTAKPRPSRLAVTASGHHRKAGSSLSPGPPGLTPSTSTTRAPAASLRARCSLTGNAGSSGTTIRSARDAANNADNEFGVAPGT